MTITFLIGLLSLNILTVAPQVPKNEAQAIKIGGAITLTQMIHQVIDLCRRGLIDAGLSNMSVPNVNWTIHSDYIGGAVQTMNIQVLDMPDFKIKKLSSSIAKMKLDIDMEFPLIGVTGDYYIDIKFLFIPISWGGSFELKFSQLEIGGSGQIKGETLLAPTSVEILNPLVTLQEVNFTFDGFPGSLNILKLIILIFLIVIVYTSFIIIIVAIFFSRRMRAKLKQKMYDPLSTK